MNRGVAGWGIVPLDLLLLLTNVKCVKPKSIKKVMKSQLVINVNGVLAMKRICNCSLQHGTFNVNAAPTRSVTHRVVDRGSEVGGCEFWGSRSEVVNVGVAGRSGLQLVLLLPRTSHLSMKKAMESVIQMNGLLAQR